MIFPTFLIMKTSILSLAQYFLFIILDFLKDFIYLFMKDTQRERGRDTGRGRSRLHAGSPMWDSIPGLQDHTLGWRQMLNHWATQVSLILDFVQWRTDPDFSEVCVHRLSWIPNYRRGADARLPPGLLHNRVTWFHILSFQGTWFKIHVCPCQGLYIRHLT